MHRASLSALLALGGIATATASAQEAAAQDPTEPAAPSAAQPADKLHPYLRDRLRTAAPDARLPVYFVLGDRLGYDHWFPRVFRMPLAVRRATVVRELREHADRTQRALRDYLDAEVAAGNVTDVQVNWLGNFVKCRAVPLAILTAATEPSVGEVWYDAEHPLAAVQDEAAPAALPDERFGGPPLRPAAAVAGNRVPGNRVPGNGPTATLAFQAWSAGFEGQGVVVLNADEGIDTSPAFHSDLAANIWQNPGEVPGNGVDDDNNGYVDDVNGWNFGANSNNLNDSGGHGSRTAGCIAADGTCTGITHGMAPLARVMTGKLGGTESSQWDAIQYGLLMGADCQTSSYSYKLYFTPPPNYRMHRDVGANSLAAGLIRTNSTSNDGGRCGSTTDPARKPMNISAPGNLPPPYLDPNQTLQGQLGGVLGVGAWNFSADVLMSYSPCGPFAWSLADVQTNNASYPAANWNPAHDDYPWSNGSQQGLLKPDVASPTSTTTTSSSPCSFVTFSGTSNATPNAIGCIAIWKGANPSLTPEDVGMIVHQTSRDRGAVSGKENDWGAGVIDAWAGLLRALIVHRVDGQPAWVVEHSVGSGPLDVAIDTLPNSFGAAIVGFSRSDFVVGPVTIGVGATFGTLFAGASGSSGDMSLGVPLIPALAGATVFTQGLVWDQTVTNTVLTSNVVEVRITP